MTKNNNTILWIIGIIILVVLISNYQKPEEGMIGLKAHYYKDGVEVFPQFSLFRFSVVTPPGGSYDQISFDIIAIAQDVSIANIQVVGAYPQIFEDALASATLQSLAIGESKKLWTSDLMDTVQFEAISPVNFWIELSGENSYTQETIYPDRAYSGDISFIDEGPFLYLAESGNDVIRKLDLNTLSTISSVSLSGMGDPALTTDGNYLYLVDQSTDRVRKLDLNTLSTISSVSLSMGSPALTMWVELSCTNTCSSLGYSCGINTICGVETDCGPCTYINFRTNGFVDWEWTPYRYGDEVAYADTCGNTLDDFGFRYACDGGVGLPTVPCSEYNGGTVRCGPSTYYDIGTKLMPIPGDDCYLYMSGTSQSAYYIYVGCTQPRGNCKVWQYRNSNPTTIDTSQLQINPSLEETC